MIIIVIVTISFAVNLLATDYNNIIVTQRVQPWAPLSLRSSPTWLETWVKEHKDACSKGHAERSTIAEHTWDQQHTIDWEDTKVLDKATRPVQLLVKEALCIQRTPANNLAPRFTFALKMTRASSRNVGKLYTDY